MFLDAVEPFLELAHLGGKTLVTLDQLRIDGLLRAHPVGAFGVVDDHAEHPRRRAVGAQAHLGQRLQIALPDYYPEPIDAVLRVDRSDADTARR